MFFLTGVEDIDEQACTVLHDTDAVSYTHLDVYKRQVKQDVICCLADSGIVCQDFVAKPCGIAVGKLLPDAVQEGVCIVVEDIIVPYEGHLAKNTYSYLTSVLSQYTTYRCRPPLA